MSRLAGEVPFPAPPSAEECQRARAGGGARAVQGAAGGAAAAAAGVRGGQRQRLLLAAQQRRHGRQHCRGGLLRGRAPGLRAAGAALLWRTLARPPLPFPMLAVQPIEAMVSMPLASCTRVLQFFYSDAFALPSFIRCSRGGAAVWLAACTHAKRGCVH